MAYRWPALAIEGGPKAKKHRYRDGNRYGKAEIREVTEAIESGKLFGLDGTKVNTLCEDFAAFTGARHCTGVSSGTAAVHVALGALGIRPGDEVITTPVTDFGTIVGILYQNAIPIFADLQPHTYNIDPASVEANITRKTAAIVAVHLGGNPCDMDALRRIAKKHHLALIEDCAQAYGARWRGATRRHAGRRRMLLDQPFQAHQHRRRRAHDHQRRRPRAAHDQIRRQELRARACTSASKACPSSRSSRPVTA